MTRRTTLFGTVAVILLASPVFIPEALAFPYHRDVRGVRVWSGVTDPARGRRRDRACRRVGPRQSNRRAADRAAHFPDTRRVAVALARGGGERAFGLTRPLSEAVVVNHSDVDADRVTNGAAIGGVRSLSGVIAHERRIA